MPPGRGVGRGAGDGTRRRPTRSAGGVAGGSRREPHVAPRDLELGLLLVHALELDLEQLGGHRPELGADRPAHSGEHQVAQGAGRHRQGGLRDVLEHAAERLPDRGLHEAADGLRRTLDQLAEELLQLLLTRDLQQLAGQSELLHLLLRLQLAAQQLAPPLLVALVLATGLPLRAPLPHRGFTGLEALPLLALERVHPAAPPV